jgi:hypothetical protein
MLKSAGLFEGVLGIGLFKSRSCSLAGFLREKHLPIPEKYHSRALPWGTPNGHATESLWVAKYPLLHVPPQS